MKVSLVKAAKTKFVGIDIEHNGEVIRFKADGSVKGGKNDHDLFQCFNSYLNIQMEESDKDKIFELYRKALFVLEPSVEGHKTQFEEYLQNNLNKDFLISKLVPIINDILDIVKPEKLSYFIDSEGIYTEIPHDLDMNQNRGDYPDAKTIGHNDYRNLVKFILIFQPVFPIINAFITHLDTQNITRSCKEAVAGELIKHNRYLVKNPSWEKILGYIRYDVDNKNINNLKVDININNNFIENTAFKLMFTRFLVFLIPTPDKTKNLAKQIFNGIRQIDTEGGTFNDKRLAGDDNTDKRSNIEMYQLYEEVKSADETADAEFFTFSLYDEEDNPRYTDRFKYQCQALGIKDEKMVEMCFDLIPNNWKFELRDHIVQLVQLALVDEISPQLIDSLDYQQLMVAMALSQVKLHEMGFPHLALLVTTIYDKTIPRADGGKFDNLDSEERKAILDICQVDQARGDTLVMNEGVDAASTFLREVFSKGWSSTIELGLLDDHKAIQSAIHGTMYEVELGREIKEEFLSLIQVQNN